MWDELQIHFLFHQGTPRPCLQAKPRLPGLVTQVTEVISGDETCQETMETDPNEVSVGAGRGRWLR